MELYTLGVLECKTEQKWEPAGGAGSGKWGFTVQWILQKAYCQQPWTVEGPPTFLQTVYGHTNTHAAGGIGGAWVGQQVAVRQLQLHENERVGAGNGVLCAAQVVLQSLTLIPAELPLPWAPGAFLTQWKNIVAEGRDGELGTLVRQLGWSADHGERS